MICCCLCSINHQYANLHSLLFLPSSERSRSPLYFRFPLNKHSSIWTSSPIVEHHRIFLLQIDAFYTGLFKLTDARVSHRKKNSFSICKTYLTVDKRCSTLNVTHEHLIVVYPRH